MLSVSVVVESPSTIIEVCIMEVLLDLNRFRGSHFVGTNGEYEAKEEWTRTRRSLQALSTISRRNSDS